MLLQQWAIPLSELIIFGKKVWFLRSILFTTLKTVLYFPLHLLWYTDVPDARLFRNFNFTIHHTNWSRITSVRIIFCVSLQVANTYRSMEVVVFLEFPLSLEVCRYQQCPSMYYFRDPPVDQYHLTDPILDKRPPPRSKMRPCRWVDTCICCIRLADVRMSASCLVSVSLWQCQCIVKLTKIKRWLLLVARG